MSAITAHRGHDIGTFDEERTPRFVAASPGRQHQHRCSRWVARRRMAAYFAAPLDERPYLIVTIPNAELPR